MEKLRRRHNRKPDLSESSQVSVASKNISYGASKDVYTPSVGTDNTNIDVNRGKLSLCFNISESYNFVNDQSSNDK